MSPARDGPEPRHGAASPRRSARPAPTTPGPARARPADPREARAWHRPAGSKGDVTLEGPVAISSVASRFGPVFFAVSPIGVTALEIGTTAEAMAASLRRRGRGPIVGEADAPAGPIADILARLGRLVAAGLRGEPADLGCLPVDLDDRPAWDRLVLGAVRAIPHGEVASYGEIARRIGSPGAARAVGAAVGRNPVGLLVPCHRVIAGDGSLGGYGVAPMGGREAALDLKRDLLELEGVTVRR